MSANRRTRPSWHAEAQRLHADGMIYRDIARCLGKSYSAVNAFFSGWGAGAGGHVVFEPHQPRRITVRLVPPDARMEAARAFAAHEIDIKELMRRIDAR